jgi:hypothetical protein
MDYTRFNYVAQPGDGVKMLSPHIGPYDMMAIEWGYRWFPKGTDEPKALQELLKKYTGKEYRYSEQQGQRTAVDPRALTEDLGDDAMKSARYGIANLKRIMPHLIDWTKNGEPGQNYDEASRLYSTVLWQWNTYLYHVLANIGGIYVERPTIDDEEIVKAYTFVEKRKQKEATQFLIDELFTYPEWLFGSDLARQIYPLRRTPIGTREQEPAMLLKNYQNYLIWDILDNERLVRMYENEWLNGKNAFTAVEMMQMLHKCIFGKSEAGRSLNVMERSLQKSFVDALMTAANESEVIKISGKKELADTKALESSGFRNVDMTNKQISRNSDAMSVKRAELMRILKLLKAKRSSGDLSTQMHYEDVILRIQSALGLKN